MFAACGSPSAMAATNQAMQNITITSPTTSPDHPRQSIANRA